jgi:hypothetical protein
MKHQLVHITWHDAHSPSGEAWIHLADIANEPCTVETVGWLIEDAITGHLVVAQSYNDSESYDNLISIPMNMVVAMKEIDSVVAKNPTREINY